MKIESIILNNIRCFRGENAINLSTKINLFVGHNNSGKSTILRSIYQLQGPLFFDRDRSIEASGASEFVIPLRKEPDHTYKFHGIPYKANSDAVDHKARVVFPTGQAGRVEIHEIFASNVNGFYANRIIDHDRIRTYTNVEPDNLIYPIFSNRGAVSFSSSTSEAQALSVVENFEHLCSKVERLTNPNKKRRFKLFNDTCKAVMGFEVGVDGYEKDKRIVFFVNDDQHIPLNSMGAGIPNLLGIIVNILVAENKIFLIEEPENDLHPKALKALLNLIVESSGTNQYFISTHSNVVVRHLGAVESTSVFHIKSETDYEADTVLPISTIEYVETKEQRMSVLSDLGYELIDFDLWAGWLLLEEYSAQSVIKEFLIPYFAPNLERKLCTCFTSGSGNIKSRFKSLNDLFVFINLTDSTYKNKAWVLIDDGNDERKVVNDLKQYYSREGWSDDHFRQLGKHNFEDYYPSPYVERFHQLLAEVDIEQNPDKKVHLKKVGKENLLKDVKTWYRDNPDQAKVAFAESAREVIDLLREIEQALS